MDEMDFATMAGMGLGSLALFLPAWGWARLRRRRRLAYEARALEMAPVASAAPARRRVFRRSATRIAALETGQAEILARLAAAESGREPEARLRALAGQLVELIRDKNTGLETALSGLDQIRGRLRALEQVGSLAETRAALDRLGERLGALQAAQESGAAALEARLGGVEAVQGAVPVAEIVGQLARLHERKDAALAAMLERLAPLEARLTEIEAAQAAARAETAAVADRAAGAAEAGRRLAAEAAERQAALEAALEAGLAGLERGLTARIDAIDWAQDELAGRVAAIPASVAPSASSSPSSSASSSPSSSTAPRSRRARPVALRVVPSAAEMEEVWSLPQLVSLHRK
jgi:hypothetical protein